MQAAWKGVGRDRWHGPGETTKTRFAPIFHDVIGHAARAVEGLIPITGRRA